MLVHSWASFSCQPAFFKTNCRFASGDFVLVSPLFNRLCWSHLGSLCKAQTSNTPHRFCTQICSSELPREYSHITVPHWFRHFEMIFSPNPLWVGVQRRCPVRCSAVWTHSVQFWLERQKFFSGMGYIKKCRHSQLPVSTSVIEGYFNHIQIHIWAMLS